MKYRIYYLKNENKKIIYVGQTTRDLKDRLNEHRKRYFSRKKCTIHLLKETYINSEADELETYYIKLYNLVDDGENITYGKGRKGLGSNDTSFKKGNSFCKMGTKNVECIETGIIYNSITQCSKILNLNPTNITACCKGKRKTTGGFHFQYV